MSELKWKCREPHCHLPWMRIVHGTLVVESRHHGKVHTNILSLGALLRMLIASQYVSEEQILEIASEFIEGPKLEALLTESVTPVILNVSNGDGSNNS